MDCGSNLLCVLTQQETVSDEPTAFIQMDHDELVHRFNLESDEEAIYIDFYCSNAIKERYS